MNITMKGFTMNQNKAKDIDVNGVLLDYSFGKKARKKIKKLLNKGKTVVLTEHGLVSGELMEIYLSKQKNGKYEILVECSAVDEEYEVEDIKSFKKLEDEVAEICCTGVYIA